MYLMISLDNSIKAGAVADYYTTRGYSAEIIGNDKGFSVIVAYTSLESLAA